jgi:5-methyltetrahydrofolate--homocysteine methyltransferase
MAFGFTDEEWRSVDANWDSWWRGALERPVIPFVIDLPERHRPESIEPWSTFSVPFSTTVSDLLDGWEAALASRAYGCDAFPSAFPNFGPGVIAAYLGAMPEPRPKEFTVWFHPPESPTFPDLHWPYSEESAWFQRMLAIYEQATERWQGGVLLDLTDLGGNMDILASFRPGEDLLLDLHDRPEEIERLIWEAHERWWQYWDRFNGILQPVNPGYGSWSGLFSRTSHYMLQCDFCFMISPEMFERFVKPELVASCRKLDHAFYHLDGPGQLPHLNSLLQIDELAGVQWVPGAGTAPAHEWTDVYRRIRKAGKLVQFMGGIDELELVAQDLGSLAGFCTFPQPVPKHRQDGFLRALERLGFSDCSLRTV